MTGETSSTFDTRYDREVSAHGADSLSRVARRIRPGSKVLDVGTGPGALGRYLTRQAGCAVDGIESDPVQAAMARPFYGRLVEADLESESLADALAPAGYDVVVCADVLEHLRDPGRALDRLVRLLRPGGRLLISIPNVGYAGVVAGLLAGEFKYSPSGLLDQTHLRFFTRRSLFRLLEEHHLGVVGMELVSCLYHQSEFGHHQLDQLPPAVREAIFAQPDALTYQFVVEALPGVRSRPEFAAEPERRVTFALQLFWRAEGQGFDESRSVAAVGEVGVESQSIRLKLPILEPAPARLRLDVADRPGLIRLHRMQLEGRDGAVVWTWSGTTPSLAGAESHGLAEFAGEGGLWWLSTTADPWVELPIPQEALGASSGGTLLIEMGWPLSAAFNEAGTWKQAADARLAAADARLGVAEDRLEALAQKSAAAAAQLETMARRIADAERGLETALRAAHLVIENAHWFERWRRVRSMVRRLRRALFPRGFSLEATPAGDVVGGGRDWESVGPDPRFSLRPSRGRLPSGWAEVDLELEAADGEVLTPALYAEGGHGSGEDAKVVLPETRQGRSRGIVKLPHAPVALRLDPLEGPGRFRMGRLEVRELPRWRAALRLGWPLLRECLKSPRGASAALARAFQVYRKDGWAALKRLFRDTAFATWARRDYPAWVRAFDTLTRADRESIAASIAALPNDLSFTVMLLLGAQDPPGDVEESVRSVETQLFDRWAGAVVGLPAGLDRFAGLFRERKRWAWPPVSFSEAAHRGDRPLAVFLRPGDVLAEHALYELADAFVRHPETEVVYPDEDSLDGDERVAPRFKPDWSPYRIWCQDYVRHRLACRSALLKRQGPAEPASSEPLFEVLLEAARSGVQVHHTPFVLFHVRRDAPRPLEEVRPALERHLREVASGARLEQARQAGTFRIRLPLPAEVPLVTVIVPTRNRGEILRGCIESLRASTDYPSYEILVVDNDSDEPQTIEYLARLEATGVARVLRHGGEFNFAAINNAAARIARGRVLALVNNDIEVHDRGWLAEMVTWALRDDVGAVGCRLRYGDGTVQHAGVVLGIGGVAGHCQAHLGADEPGYLGGAWALREVSAVTAACLVLRREVFDEVQGFDERLRVAFNDVDLCLRIRQRGRSVLYTPFADLIHLESATRGHDQEPGKSDRLRQEADLMRSRYGKSLLHDPYYSPNLSLDSTAPDLAFPPRVHRPWRGVRAVGPKIAFLTYRLAKGYGVDLVVSEQVEYLCAHDYDVTVLVRETDGHYDSRLGSYVASGHLRIVKVSSVEEAISYFSVHEIEIVAAHTPPFFEALAALPARFFRVLFDYGEPPARLFEDASERRRIAERKVAISQSVDLVVAISRFVQADSGLRDPQLCFLGNDHLLRRRSNLAKLAGRFRLESRLGDAFVVLNVTRYLAAERRYKGVEHYAAVRDSLFRSHPELQGRVRFVVAGRSEPADRAWAESRGLVALSNLDDDQIVAAYLDSNLYLSTSQWEGYNLGLAQALALGVPTVASACGAHGEFPIRTSNDPEVLAGWIHAEVIRQDLAGQRLTPRASLQRLRKAVVLPWRAVGQRFETLVLEGLERRGRWTPNMPPDRAEAAGGTPPVVSFLILNKDKPELLIPCIRSIEEHCDVSYEILIGDTGSTDPETLRFYESTPHQVHYLGFYNFSASNNILAARAAGRHLLFLNNDTKLIKTSFKEAIEHLASHPDVACLGGYLVYADHRIQHAGVRLCPEAPYRGIPEHFDRFKPIEGYPGLAAPREVVAVTGAMMLIGAEQFAAMGGFDEVYEEEAQDVDLCLRLRARGLRSLVHPALYAYHYENSTRTVKEAPGDRQEFMRRYGGLIEEVLFPWQVKAGLV